MEKVEKIEDPRAHSRLTISSSSISGSRAFKALEFGQRYIKVLRNSGRKDIMDLARSSGFID